MNGRGGQVGREERIDAERKAGNARDWGKDVVQGRKKTEVHRGKYIKRCR